MSEKWKTIPSYEGFYEASSEGRVRSLDRVVPWMNSFRNQKGRILKPSLNSDGYLNVVLCKNGINTTYSVHILVMLAFVGPCPANKETRHLNGIRTDCRKLNLKYGTRKVNQRDRRKHGTAPIGSQSGAAKLTEKDIPKIRELCLRRTYREIADMYGVSEVAIHYIFKKKSWKHI